MKVRFVIDAELHRADGSDPSVEEVMAVLADAAVMVAEPIFERPADGNDVEGVGSVEYYRAECRSAFAGSGPGRILGMWRAGS